MYFLTNVISRSLERRSFYFAEGSARRRNAVLIKPRRVMTIVRLTRKALTFLHNSSRPDLKSRNSFMRTVQKYRRPQLDSSLRREIDRGSGTMLYLD